MLKKLKDSIIKNAKPKANGKPRSLSDGGGLQVLVTKTGKYWRYNYRHDQKQKTLALGTYPDIKLIEARELHEAARTLLSAGIVRAWRRRPRNGNGSNRPRIVLKR